MEALRQATAKRSMRRWKDSIELPPQPTNGAHADPDVATILQDRLQELEIFELTKDGHIEYHSLTVRGLYKYVLDSIVALRHQVTSNLASVNDEDDNDDVDDVKAKEEESKNVFGSPLASPIVLGALVPPVHLGTTASAKPPVSSDNKTSNKPEQRNKKRNKNKRNRSRSRNVTYHERLGGFLHPRDMRRLTTPVSSSNEPEIMVRRHVMLFNFNPVRAIVTRDRMLLVLPENKLEADWIIDHLVNQIQGKPAAIPEKETNKASDDGENCDKIKSGIHGQPGHASARNVFGKLKIQSTRFMRSETELTADESEEGDNGSSYRSTDGGKNINDDDTDEEEWDEMRRNDWIKLPFELQCLDSVLFCVNELHEKDTKELVDDSSEYFNFMVKQNKNLGGDHFRIIRCIKDGRQEVASRVKGFCASLTRILNEDEDMALMNLSRLLTHPQNFVRPVSQEVLENESEEPELILESHLQAGFSLMNTLELIDGQVESASDYYEQQLDSTRNKILLANMLLTTGSFCLTAAAVVGSFYGMNVGVPGEGEQGFFTPIVVATMGGSLLLGLIILFVLAATGTIQRTAVYAIDDDDL